MPSIDEVYYKCVKAVMDDEAASLCDPRYVYVLSNAHGCYDNGYCVVGVYKSLHEAEGMLHEGPCFFPHSEQSLLAGAGAIRRIEVGASFDSSTEVAHSKAWKLAATLTISFLDRLIEEEKAKEATLPPKKKEFASRRGKGCMAALEISEELAEWRAALKSGIEKEGVGTSENTQGHHIVLGLGACKVLDAAEEAPAGTGTVTSSKEPGDCAQPSPKRAKSEA